MDDGYGRACVYGKADDVEFLVQMGMEVDAKVRAHSEGAQRTPRRSTTR
jgi:hypothetical protein